MVGVIPILPAAIVPEAVIGRSMELGKHFARFMANLGITDERLRTGGFLTGKPGMREMLFSVIAPVRLERVLREVLAEDAFLSPFGLRAVSRRHRDAPFRLEIGGATATVDYEPGESTSGMFGGNSNWRGPVWFPLNYLVIESLRHWDDWLGADFMVEYPTGSGRRARLLDVGRDLARRLVAIWLPDADGRRPVPRPLRALLERPGVARPAPLPRVLPRRHGGRDRGLPPDRLDRSRGPPAVPRRDPRSGEHGRAGPRGVTRAGGRWLAAEDRAEGTQRRDRTRHHASAASVACPGNARPRAARWARSMHGG